MTGEIVNLRMARKRKRRATAEDEAARNRLSHGRSKAERQAASLETARLDRLHSGGRLDPQRTADDQDSDV
ncbi:DUF4169 family protein [Pseudohoeflea coraliihabitans]|uniref:DUF4169 family protein n=1 Tax=Pseudohoeflea coraliihabitans TaxID=2860393 RepID=A0ABS6WIY1_9HYPH|nr:DUF4169 family protein [Pseudohoeflea sp. DP4N28-3]MBW3095889.1 DUF4169 family protein [Pseudohoeflea sp. DP4N28-3]